MAAKRLEQILLPLSFCLSSRAGIGVARAVFRHFNFRMKLAFSLSSFRRGGSPLCCFRLSFV